MIFQVTHTHTNETCPGVVPEIMTRLGTWWNDLKGNASLKVLGGYVSPMDHTIHITIEAEDYPSVARALGPLNSIGSGAISPVLTLDQAMPMAESGAFR